MRFPGLPIALLGAVLIAACDDDNGPPVTPTSQASATPVATQVVEATATPVPQATPAPREVTGLFTDPRPRAADRTVSVPPRPPSPFQPWDRESVVVYDIVAGTARNFGPGYVPSMSPDETRLAYNLRPQTVRVVELATGETVEEFEWRGTVTFLNDDYLRLPDPGSDMVHHLRSGARFPADELDDPVLRTYFEWLRGNSVALTTDAAFRLRQPFYDEAGSDACRGLSESEYELCRAEAHERWVVEDVQTGMPVLTFRAYSAGSAGPGEAVIATSPQCTAEDGSLQWCPEVLEALRADYPPGQFPYEEAHGTTNIFILNIVTGEAEFIATASFTPDTHIVPENWPLIANRDHVVWTESYCSQSQGNTRIYDRATGMITELDVSLWVAFTATGDLGVDQFGPSAILSIETLDWDVVLPDGVIDVGESSGGRYLYVGGVLGHGGLCG